MTAKKNTTPTAAELSRIALDEARSKLATWQELHEQAETAAAELLSRLAGGDETPTGLDLATADAEAKRAAVLMQAGESLVKRAERALINDDTALAEVFADVLAEAFAGLVPVQIVTIPAEVKASPRGEPALFVLQDKPGSNNGGTLSGELVVTYYRNTLLAPLNAREVEELCRARGYAVEVRPRSSGRVGDHYEDSASFRVFSASPPVPVLAATPDAAAVRYFAQGANGALADAVRVPSDRPKVTGEPQTVESSSELTGYRVVSSEPGTNGEVRLTVETTSRVLPSPKLKTGYAHERLRRAITDRVGFAEVGTGRVVAAEPVSVEVPEPTPGIRKAWTVKGRYVVAYRLA